MPTPKQMEKLAAEAIRKQATQAAGPEEPLSPEYWDSVLSDPRAAITGADLRQRHLSEIQRHVLRVSRRRCDRTVEIQTADAVRLYGRNALWKDVAQRLLDNTCQERTGRHEEDGCWPAFEAPYRPRDPHICFRGLDGDKSHYLIRLSYPRPSNAGDSSRFASTRRNQTLKPLLRACGFRRHDW